MGTMLFRIFLIDRIHYSMFKVERSMLGVHQSFFILIDDSLPAISLVGHIRIYVTDYTEFWIHGCPVIA